MQVDHSIAVAARRLLRANPALKKPNDGIHLATAVIHSVEEMHTFDEENLIKLDGQIAKKDGSFLKICHPHKPTNIQLQLDVAPAANTSEEKPAAKA